MPGEDMRFGSWVVLGSLLAAGAVGGAASARADADLAAGRAVVVGGQGASVTPCFLCHALDGVGDSAGAFPRLTGQAGFYMYKQLLDYASGDRPNDVMSPIAREMTEAQMEDVAFYYAVVDAPNLHRTEVPAEVVERGRQIAEDGLPAAGVQACNFCHGQHASGNPPLFPYLAGQYAPYTELQLQLFKRGERRNDGLAVMRQIAERLSDDDIRALALYFEWLRPEPPEEPDAAPSG